MPDDEVSRNLVTESFYGIILRNLGLGGERVRRGVAGRVLPRRQLAGSFQHRISDRADVRVNALEVAQDIEVQRARLDAFRPPFTEPFEMPVAGCKLNAAQ